MFFNKANDYGNCSSFRFYGTSTVKHNYESCLNRRGIICASERNNLTQITLIMSLVFFVESTYKCTLLFLRISILYILLNILLINNEMNNLSKNSIGVQFEYPVLKDLDPFLRTFLYLVLTANLEFIMLI